MGVAKGVESLRQRNDRVKQCCGHYGITVYRGHGRLQSGEPRSRVTRRPAGGSTCRGTRARRRGCPWGWEGKDMRHVKEAGNMSK